MAPPTDPLRAWADRLAPTVLAEAVAEATERARAQLVDQLTQAIVERALAGSPAQPHEHPRTQTPDPAADEAPTPPATGLYAFGIIAARPVDLSTAVGIDGTSPLRIVVHDGLGLVVSPVRLSLLDEVSEDDLSETGTLATLARRHDDVVRQVFEHGPVLPLRFGTVVADEDGGRRLLDQQAGPAQQQLEHLDTHREWGVRLRRSSTSRDADDAGPGARRQQTGTAYLASRREALQHADREEHQAADATARVQSALRAGSVDMVHRGGAPGSELVADLAFLVPADSEQSFLGAVGELAEGLAADGLALDTTGPWPPYSFASLADDVADFGRASSDA